MKLLRYINAITGWLLVLAIAAPLLVTLALVLPDDITWPGTPIRFLGEALLLALPWWWLRGRWRVAALVPVWAVPAFLFANVVYWRAFGEFMPFEAVTYTANFNTRLADSAASLLTCADLWYLLAPALFTAWYVALRSRIETARPFRLRSRIAMTVAALAAFSLSQWSYTTLYAREVEWYKNRRTRASWALALQRITQPTNTPRYDYQSNGLTVYLVKSLATALSGGPRDEALDDIELARFLAELRSLPQTPDSLFAANRGKNLVMVVVESLNAWVADSAPGGREITPTINALLRDSATVSARAVVAQVSRGVSADGQFVLQTGLLPLRSLPVAMHYESDTFPSLPRMLSGYHCTQHFVEAATYWHMDRLVKVYGYDSFYDAITRGSDDFNTDGDASVLREAAALLPRMPQPFFAFITTLSMHMPFNDPAAADAFPDSLLRGYSRNERAYIRSAAYFDRCLADFIAALKAEGLWDNTVLVVTGDHNCLVDRTAMGETPALTPGLTLFLAANAGLSHTETRPVGQVDLFPTVLDIMGVSASPRPGVGRSILAPGFDAGAIDRLGTLHGTPSEPTARRLNDAWRASAAMIQDNRFP